MKKMSSPFLVLLSLLFVSTLINLTHSYSVPTFSSKVSSDEVNVICSKAKNGPVCISDLNSDPQTATSDLKGLCQISIGRARFQATAAFDSFGSRGELIPDPTIKAQYATCRDYYDEAIAALLLAEKNLATGDYGAVRDAAIIAGKEAVDCAQLIGSTAPGDMRIKNTHMEEFANIVECVAAYALKM